MRTWSPIFHFYQPPTQKVVITKEVYRTSYKPFFDLIKANPQIAITVNISGSLIEQLYQIKCTEFFDQLNELVQKKQLELITSAMYHPLLPLINSESIVRQVHQNTATIQERTIATPLSVLFPPELAVDTSLFNEVAPLVEYCLVDESTIVGNNFSLDTIPSHSFYEYEGLKLLMSSRSITEILRAYPRKIDPDAFISFFLDHTQEETTVISVNDVELFGHHYSGRFNLLEKVLADERIQIRPLSSILSEKHEYLKTEPQSSTWVTTTQQINENKPFVLWDDFENLLQKQYVAFMNFVEKTLDSFDVEERDPQIFPFAERHFDIGSSSCHLYWLSSWPWWHPDLSEKGSRNLLRAIRTMPVSKEIKIEAEKRYTTFLKDIWTHHWEGLQTKHIAEFDAYREEFLKTLPNLDEQH